MGKDFAIVPIKNLNVDATSKIIESVMKISKIYDSRKNQVVVGIDEKIIFDINTEIIKGKILCLDDKREAAAIRAIIRKMGNDDVYVHFYGKRNFLATKKIREV